MTVLTGGAVRRAVMALLQANLQPVLDRLAVAEQIALPAVRSWDRLPDFTVIAESQSPAVIVTTPGPGQIDQPIPGRQPIAPWDVRVFVVVRGRTFEETADRVAAYTAAVRTVLLSAQGLPGLSPSVHWTAERYTELAASADRTVGAGSVTVTYPGLTTDTI